MRAIGLYYIETFVENEAYRHNNLRFCEKGKSYSETKLRYIASWRFYSQLYIHTNFYEL